MTYCWERNDVFGIPLLKCTFLAREKSISNFENFYNSDISCSTTCTARLQYGSTAARNIFFYPLTKIEGFSNFRTKFRKISKIISEAAFHVRHILTSAMTSYYVLVSRESNRNWHKCNFFFTHLDMAENTSIKVCHLSIFFSGPKNTAETHQKTSQKMLP